MKKAISLLAVSLTYASSQAVFSEQVDSAQANLLQKQNLSLIPKYVKGQYGINYWIPSAG